MRAAARNAERIRRLQRTAWNLERLILLRSSIRKPNHLPVTPRPTIRTIDARSTRLTIQVMSLVAVGMSIPASAIAMKQRSTALNVVVGLQGICCEGFDANILVVIMYLSPVIYLKRLPSWSRA